MMISKKIADALNEQTKNEFYAYWAYLAMSFSLETMGLKVFAKWFLEQASEEQVHAMKMAGYIIDQGAEVRLMPLDQPRSNFNSVQEVVEEALKQEIGVTKNINDLVKLARDESDFATESFLQWYLSEQVEEVATVTELLDLVKMADGSGQLLMLEERIMSLRQEGESPD